MNYLGGTKSEGLAPRIATVWCASVAAGGVLIWMRDTAFRPGGCNSGLDKTRGGNATPAILAGSGGMLAVAPATNFSCQSESRRAASETSRLGGGANAGETRGLAVHQCLPERDGGRDRTNFATGSTDGRAAITAKPDQAIGHKAVGHDAAENGAIVKLGVSRYQARPGCDLISGDAAEHCGVTQPYGESAGFFSREPDLITGFNFATGRLNRPMSREVYARPAGAGCESISSAWRNTDGGRFAIMGRMLAIRASSNLAALTNLPVTEGRHVRGRNAGLLTWRQEREHKAAGAAMHIPRLTITANRSDLSRGKFSSAAGASKVMPCGCELADLRATRPAALIF